MMSNIVDGSHIGGDDLHSFLMIGQSNMAGRGDLSDVTPINNFRCYMLRMGRFLRMSEPTNPDRAIFGKGFTSGVGPAPSFADEFANYNKARVGLIPCADGGTSIDEWQPGTPLFDHAVFMTRLAMRSSKFSGFLWHQGESDCENEVLLSEYKPKFLHFVKSIRRELGAENLPFIAGEISENMSEAWNFGDRPVRFNRMLNSLTGEIENFGVASSAGLLLKADGIHFTSGSARELGKRYFNVYRSLIK